MERLVGWGRGEGVGGIGEHPRSCLHAVALRSVRRVAFTLQLSYPVNLWSLDSAFAFERPRAYLHSLALRAVHNFALLQFNRLISPMSVLVFHCSPSNNVIS